MYLCLSTITSEGGLAVQYFAHRASYCAGDGCSALRFALRTVHLLGVGCLVLEIKVRIK